MRVLTVRSKKSFFIVRMVVYGLKIIGLAPFSIPIKFSTQIHSQHTHIQAFQSSTIGLVYNLLLLVFALIMSAFVYPRWFSSIMSKLSTRSVMAISIHVMENFLLCVAAFVIIISWGFRQKNAAWIMNRLLEVDIQLSVIQRQLLNKRALTFLIIHVILNAVLWIIIWYVIVPHSIGYTLVFAVFDDALRNIIFWFILEYFTIVSLVARDLQTVNNYLLAFKEFENYSYPPRIRNCHLAVIGLPTYYRSRELTSLKLVHGVRTTLFELCEDIADFFSLPILLCIGSAFVSLFRQLGTVIIFGDLDITPTETALWSCGILLKYFYPITSLALSVTRTTNEAKLTGQIVQKLLAATVGREIKAELKAFSRQLLYENVNFTAYGFFPLDSTLLQSILGGVATYFIILMQFQNSSCTCESTPSVYPELSNATFRTIT